MVKQSNWRNSEAKRWIKKALEDGRIDPCFCDISELYNQKPELFHQYPKDRFRDNTRNLFRRFQKKRPPASTLSSKGGESIMDRNGEGKLKISKCNLQK